MFLIITQPDINASIGFSYILIFTEGTFSQHNNISTRSKDFVKHIWFISLLAHNYWWKNRLFTAKCSIIYSRHGAFPLPYYAMFSEFVDFVATNLKYFNLLTGRLKYKSTVWQEIKFQQKKLLEEMTDTRRR